MGRRFKSVGEHRTVEQSGERGMDGEMSGQVETILSLLLLTVWASSQTDTYTNMHALREEHPVHPSSIDLQEKAMCVCVCVCVCVCMRWGGLLK